MKKDAKMVAKTQMVVTQSHRQQEKWLQSYYAGLELCIVTM